MNISAATGTQSGSIPCECVVGQGAVVNTSAATILPGSILSESVIRQSAATANPSATTMPINCIPAECVVC